MTSHSAAENLTGIDLPGGWTVEAKVGKDPDATGGHFSVSYTVTNTDGRRAFLKALDYSDALQSHNPAQVLQAMTEAFNFERDLLFACGERGMTRIVRAIDSGVVRVPGFQVNAVDYLIFEHAENGDIRAFIGKLGGLDDAMLFRTMHNVATGLRQLHGIDVAHQDLKPSNVLVFDDASAKVADLGRASLRGGTAPADLLDIAGDRGYAPPEQLYGYQAGEWDRRRQACDVYHLGSLLFFLLTGESTTTDLLSHLDRAHLPVVWQGTYQQVLPYVLRAFDESEQTLAQVAPSAARPRLVTAFHQLCHPDPSRRGHPAERRGAGSQYSLERFVSLFDLLARRSEVGFRAST